MDIKDYYSILEIQPLATLPEIKKTYRRLAQQYHPDKNDNDPLSAARFSAIKEAYEVLTNPVKKERYLRQRWYNRSAGIQKTQSVITPAAILKQAIELDRYVSRLDHFRTDTERLHDYILHFLSDDTIEKLNLFTDDEMNEKIIHVLLKCFQPLSMPQALSLQLQVLKLNLRPKAKEDIDRFIAKRKRATILQKYKAGVIFLLTILLCFLFYLLGRQS